MELRSLNFQKDVMCKPQQLFFGLKRDLFKFSDIRKLIPHFNPNLYSNCNPNRFSFVHSISNSNAQSHNTKSCNNHKPTGLEDTPETLKNGTIAKDGLKDEFQARYPGISVNFIVLGTGADIAQWQRGETDMLLVHSPSQELTFLKAGYCLNLSLIEIEVFDLGCV